MRRSRRHSPGSQELGRRGFFSYSPIIGGGGTSRAFYTVLSEVRMNILESLQQAIPFLQKNQAGLPRGEMMALKPLRSRDIEWEQGEEGSAAGMKLIVPRREDRLGQIIARVFKIPESRTIELDEFGAQVWARCDGQHSVEQLIEFTCSEYKLNRRQGEVSIVAFMKMLAQRRLIGIPVASSTRAQAEGKGTGHVHPRSQRSKTKKRRRH